MISVMWTCQNDLGLNLYVVPSTSYVVTISEDDFVRSYKERSKHVAINTRDLALLQTSFSLYLHN